MSFYLSPFSTFLQLFSQTGIPLGGGLCWTYLAGTSTPGATYTDQTGGVQNANPIQMDSNGRLPNVAIWQQGGIPLKFVFSTNAGTTASPVLGIQLGPTFDQISGINDPALSGFVTGSTGTGNVTWTGFTGTPPTSVLNYSIIQNQVTVSIAPVTGTSNSTSLIMTGMPAAIIPPTLTQVTAVPTVFLNNGAAITGGAYVQASSTGSWLIGVNGSNAPWTASGTKGMNVVIGFSYLLI